MKLSVSATLCRARINVMLTKLIIQGRWVLDGVENWQLTIDPYVEVYKVENNRLVINGAFLLADLDCIEDQRKYNRNAVELEDLNGTNDRLTIVNLGDYIGDRSGYEYQIHLVLAPTDLAESARTTIFEARVSDITVDEDEDELIDIEIVRLLKTLKAPNTLTCSGGSKCFVN